MTIIDTTLYANGALRLSRHGADLGGTVLIYTWPDQHTTQQLDIPAAIDSDVEKYIALDSDAGINAETIFQMAGDYVSEWQMIHPR